MWTARKLLNNKDDHPVIFGSNANHRRWVSEKEDMLYAVAGLGWLAK